jgi:hypothetical protein
VAITYYWITFCTQEDDAAFPRKGLSTTAERTFFSPGSNMKDIVVFLLLAILGFLLWNRGVFMNGEGFVNVSDQKPVNPATIQTIINAIQAKNPDVYPVQTIYINSMQGDQGSAMYDARIMFINTRGYFGVQYDIKADSDGNILEMSEQPQPGIGAADVFEPFGPSDSYTTFEDTQVVLDKQFADLKTQVPGYQGKLDIWLEQMRQENMSNANAAARNGTVVSMR